MQEITKKQKMLIGTIVAGLGALAVDKLVLGPPDSASAGQAQAVSPTAKKPAAQAAAPNTLGTAVLGGGATPAPGGQQQSDQPDLPSFASLTQRMAKLQSSGPAQPVQTGDPFALPEDWQEKKPESVDKAAVVEPKQAYRQGPKLLLEQFTLNSTYRSSVDNEVKAFAVVNGRVLAVGQSISVKLTKPMAGTDKMVEKFWLAQVKVGSGGPGEVIWESDYDGRQVVMRMPSVLPDTE